MVNPRGFWWVLGVGVVYLLLLGAAIGATLWEFKDGGGLLWLIVGAVIVILLAQAAMLWVPVQAARERLIARRSLWIPLAGSGFFAGLLVLGGGMALLELFRATDDWFSWSVIGLAVACWGFWCVLFWLISRRQTPDGVAKFLHRWLLAGSALELIVAVTAHIIVRRRSECCAGIMTGFGIACGVAVALAVFGPAVALLFVARWKKLRVPRTGFEVMDVHPADSPPKELPKP